MPIRFLFQIENFNFRHKRIIKSWISFCSSREGKKIKELDFVFCTDTFLTDLNIQYLKHNTYTDILTFDYSDNKWITGEIYVSKDRVYENSLKFKTSFELELQRVMIHGVLHLCGYADKKKSQKIAMRKKEDSCLSLLEKMFHVKRS